MNIIYGSDSTIYTGADAQAALSSLKNYEQRNNGGDDDKTNKAPNVGQQLLDGNQVIGKGMSSGAKLAAGDYWGPAADFETAQAELFTFGLAIEVKLGLTVFMPNINRIK